MPQLSSLFPDELNPKGGPKGQPGGKTTSPAPRGPAPLPSASSPAKGPRTCVKDLVAGQEIKDIYLVEDASLRVAKNGSKYVQATFGDRSGSIPVRHWDASETDFRNYRIGGYLQVHGRIETYQSRLQMIAFKVEAVEANRVEAADFLLHSARDLGQMKTEFQALLDSLKDPLYQGLLKAIFADPGVREAFFAAPAASTLHHAWIGGLLEHVLSAAATAEAVARQRPFLDRDLLLAGVILHDIGKIEELEAAPGFGYTDTGRLCGHIALGALLVERFIAGLPDFPPKQRNLILHMILSHHGTLEFGSPVVPCTAEAVCLHYIECLDAKVQGIQTILDRERANGGDNRWTDFARIVDSRIFKG